MNISNNVHRSIEESYLMTFNFNHLLDTIADDEVTVVVIVTNIT